MLQNGFRSHCWPLMLVPEGPRPPVRPASPAVTGGSQESPRRPGKAEPALSWLWALSRSAPCPRYDEELQNLRLIKRFRVAWLRARKNVRCPFLPRPSPGRPVGSPDHHRGKGAEAHSTPPGHRPLGPASHSLLTIIKSKVLFPFF